MERFVTACAPCASVGANETPRFLGWNWIRWSGLVAAAAVVGIAYFLTARDDDQTAGELLFLAFAQLPGIAGGIGVLMHHRWTKPVLLLQGASRANRIPIRDGTRCVHLLRAVA